MGDLDLPVSPAQEGGRLGDAFADFHADFPLADQGLDNLLPVRSFPLPELALSQLDERDFLLTLHPAL